MGGGTHQGIRQGRRRVPQAQGMHGQPQWDALCNELGTAWALLQTEFSTEFILEGPLAQFDELLTMLLEWLKHTEKDWPALLEMVEKAQRISTACGQAAEAARSCEQSDARASWKRWVSESLDAGARVAQLDQRARAMDSITRGKRRSPICQHANARACS